MCLLYDQHFDTRMSRTERDRRLLNSIPDDEGPFALPSALTIRIPSRAQPTIRAYKAPPLQSVSGISLDELPRELLKVAQSPIVKGAGLGIVGNIKEVIEARRLVRECLQTSNVQDVKAKCDVWMEKMVAFVDDAVEEQEAGSIGKFGRKRPRMRWERACKKADIDLPLLCSSCSSPV